MSSRQVIFVTFITMLATSTVFARIGKAQAEEDQSETAKEVYEDKTCGVYERVIVPKIAQNTNGQLKVIPQSNYSHSLHPLQPVSIILCSNPGSSCLGCLPPDTDPLQVVDKICQQSYKEVILLVRGENGRDLVEDTFRMPAGCRC